MANEYPDLKDPAVRKSLGLPPRDSKKWLEFHEKGYRKSRAQPKPPYSPEQQAKRLSRES